MIDTRVLIVDDNATTRGVLARQLQHQGCRVTACDNGPEGLLLLQAAAVGKDAFAIALVDAVTPGMSGVQFARAARADAGLDATRLVLLSPIDVRTSSAELSAAGLAAVITKPVKRAELLDCVQHLTGRETLRSSKAEAEWSGHLRTAPTFAGHVLVVDDNLVNQKVAQRFLQRFGCEVTIANDGAEAVRLSAQHTFDLILMDLHMPVMDGCEATRLIRAGQSQRTRSPIVALTATADAKQIEVAQGAGMDDYLTKPIEIDQLQTVLARFLLGAESATAAIASAG